MAAPCKVTSTLASWTWCVQVSPVQNSVSWSLEVLQRLFIHSLCSIGEDTGPRGKVTFPGISGLGHGQVM